MVGSRTPRIVDPLAALAAATVIGVAYSGGRDSSALLHATCLAAIVRSCRVVAFHVHHGLQAEANVWLAQVRQQCALWASQGLPVQFDHRHLDVSSLRPGDSVEAWARHGRYRALTDMATEHGVDAVLLAHHRQDQAETFLIQALRGAGPKGLAAMPQTVTRQGVLWVRPWLDLERSAINAYIAAYGLDVIEDPSNTDVRYQRNRWRQSVWPSLMEVFPSAEVSLSRAARHAQEASECLDILGQMDVAAMRSVSNGVTEIDLPTWSSWPEARRRNALRYWLGVCLRLRVSASLVDRLGMELMRSTTRQQWSVPGGTLCRSNDQLVWVARVAPADLPPSGVANRESVVAGSTSVLIHGPGRYPMPHWRGVLDVVPAAAQGLIAKPVALEARPRCGGETFQWGPGRPPRSLKKQFQSAKIPGWCRCGFVLWCGDQLAFVPGLGIDARVWAPPSHEQWQLRWIADGAA